MAHSNIFAGAWTGHKFPDSIYNSGPLPPQNTSGYPNGLGAQADARINYNSTLLGDLQPYAYGKPGRLSSQTAYLPVPHMLQKLVPALTLPAAHPSDTNDGLTTLYHAVDDGDLAFTIALNRCQDSDDRYDNMQMQIFGMSGAYRGMMDALCNLCTVNYLLAGIQLYSGVDATGNPRINQYPTWKRFLRDVGIIMDDGYEDTDFTELKPGEGVLKLITEIFIPFGIPRGSDMQGGQSQGTRRPDLFPVDHVTSLLLDGKCQNLVNIWRKQKVNAGDSMILVLRKEVPGSYVLSRQTNSFNLQDFSSNKEIRERRQDKVWQLYPHILNLRDSPEDHDGYDYRDHTYWHIGMALQSAGKDPSHDNDRFNDATRYRKTGELFEVSFQPVLVVGHRGNGHRDGGTGDGEKGGGGDSEGENWENVEEDDEGGRDDHWKHLQNEHVLGGRQQLHKNGNSKHHKESAEPTGAFDIHPVPDPEQQQDNVTAPESLLGDSGNTRPNQSTNPFDLSGTTETREKYSPAVAMKGSVTGTAPKKQKTSNKTAKAAALLPAATDHAMAMSTDTGKFEQGIAGIMQSVRASVLMTQQQQQQQQQQAAAPGEPPVS